ncbi:spore coat protein U domain-containing protein [Thioalkalivibrio sp. ALJT]|uniref:Csu type fimbrial protein n=1 Tax=Thioalkalivibrio sp. ALJT TaxID=1158146 RepID=UPI000475D24F|nr:spore coat protein U domain-containing protein [Thioalkalivibrio sp. ALJT]
MFRRVLAAGVLGAVALAALPVQAATTCSASMTDVSFGASDPFTGWSDVTATISYECSTSGLSVLGNTRARLCFSIGSGSQGSGSIQPRRMTSDGNEVQFNLFRDAAHSQVWPDSLQQDTQVDLQYSLSLLGGGSGSGSVTVYGRIGPDQTAVIPGSYDNSFSGPDARMEFRANEPTLLGTPPWPDSCTSGGGQGGTDSFPFTTSATVAAACNPSFSLEDLDFGTQGLLNTAVDTTAIIAPQCTNTTPYQMGLDNGLHADGTTRRMHNGAGDYVIYELYRDAARSLRWGDTLNVDTLADTGTGSAQAQPIYGRVDPQITPPQGLYSDTVTVTIYY